MPDKNELVAKAQTLFPRVTHRILDRDDGLSERAARKLYDALNGAAAELGLPVERLTERVPDRLEIGTLLERGEA